MLSTREQGSRFVGINGKRCRWSGNNDEMGNVGILMKEVREGCRSSKKKRQSDGNGAGF